MRKEAQNAGRNPVKLKVLSRPRASRGNTIGARLRERLDRFGGLESGRTLRRAVAGDPERYLSPRRPWWHEVQPRPYQSRSLARSGEPESGFR
jgi:hypothetical protein